MTCAGHASKLIWLRLAAGLLAIVLPGCASFKVVSTFASLSAKGVAHDAVTQDYVGAIDRRKQYQPQKFQAELEAMKIRREAQSAALGMLQRIMTDYMQGLGDLASGNIRSYDESLEDFSENLNKVSLLNDKEKDAAGALSTLLARSVTAIYRRHEVRKLIQDGNQPLQDVVTATRKIVKDGIIPDLQVESALVERYYDNFMLAPGNPVEPVAMALARKSKAEELAGVHSRIQTAQRYDAVLERTALGHQYLYNHREIISNDKVSQRLEPYAQALRITIKDLLDVSR
jgi:hypothetical protein